MQVLHTSGAAFILTLTFACQVRRQGSADKVIARVLHVGHDCDLALLTVDDEDFWQGLDTTPLELGGTILQSS